MKKERSASLLEQLIKGFKFIILVVGFALLGVIVESNNVYGIPLGNYLTCPGKENIDSCEYVYNLAGTTLYVEMENKSPPTGDRKENAYIIIESKEVTQKKFFYFDEIKDTSGETLRKSGKDIRNIKIILFANGDLYVYVSYYKSILDNATGYGSAVHVANIKTEYKELYNAMNNEGFKLRVHFSVDGNAEMSIEVPKYYFYPEIEVKSIYNDIECTSYENTYNCNQKPKKSHKFNVIAKWFELVTNQNMELTYTHGVPIKDTLVGSFSKTDDTNTGFFTTTITPITHDDYPNGEYHMQITVTDTIERKRTITLKFVYDNAPPVFESVKVIQDNVYIPQEYLQEYEVKVTYSDDSEIEEIFYCWTKNENEALDEECVSKGKNISNETGQYYLYTKAKDIAGNQSTYERIGIFLLDNKAPILQGDEDNKINSDEDNWYTEDDSVLYLNFIDEDVGNKEISDETINETRIKLAYCWTLENDCEGTYSWSNDGKLEIKYPDGSGEYTLKVYAKDSLDNKDVWTTIRYVDNEAPYIDDTNDFGSNEYQQEYTVTVNYTDDHSGLESTEYCWTASSMSADDCEFDGNTIYGVTGTYYLYTKGIDVVENGDWIQIGSYLLDNTAPIYVDGLYEDKNWFGGYEFNGLIDFYIVYSDEHVGEIQFGYEVIFCKKEGDCEEEPLDKGMITEDSPKYFSNEGWCHSIENIKKSGIYKLEVYAQDILGNVAEVKSAIRYVDLEAPYIDDINDFGSNEYQKEYTVTINYTDDHSGLESTEYCWTANNKEAKDCEFEDNKIDGVTGTYYLYTKGIDVVENGDWIQIGSYLLDNTAPLYISGLNVDNTWYGGPNFDGLTFSVVFKDEHVGTQKSGIIIYYELQWCEYEEGQCYNVSYGNGTDAISGEEIEISPSMYDSTGIYKFIVSAEDSLGNCEVGKSTIRYVDNEAPYIDDINDFGSNEYQKEYTVTVNYTDDHSGLESTEYCWTANNKEAKDCEFEDTKIDGVTGDYYLYTRGKDNLNNTNGWEQLGLYKLDNTAPEINAEDDDTWYGGFGFDGKLYFSLEVYDEHVGMYGVYYKVFKYDDENKSWYEFTEGEQVTDEGKLNFPIQVMENSWLFQEQVEATGKYKIEYSAKDKLGTQTEIKITYRYVDMILTEVSGEETIDIPRKGGYEETLTIEDKHSGIRMVSCYWIGLCEYDREKSTLTLIYPSSSYDGEGALDGFEDIKILIYDNAYNEYESLGNEQLLFYKRYVDNIIPILTITSNVDKEYEKEGQEIIYTIKASEGVMFDFTKLSIKGLDIIGYSFDKDGEYKDSLEQAELKETLYIKGTIIKGVDKVDITLNEEFAFDKAKNSNELTSKEIKVLRIKELNVFGVGCNFIEETQKRYCNSTDEWGPDEIHVNITFNYEISKILAGTLKSKDITSYEKESLELQNYETEETLKSTHVFFYVLQGPENGVYDEDREIESFILTNDIMGEVELGYDNHIVIDTQMEHPNFELYPKLNENKPKYKANEYITIILYFKYSEGMTLVDDWENQIEYRQADGSKGTIEFIEEYDQKELAFCEDKICLLKFKIDTKDVSGEASVWVEDIAKSYSDTFNENGAVTIDIDAEIIIYENLPSENDMYYSNKEGSKVTINIFVGENENVKILEGNMICIVNEDDEATCTSIQKAEEFELNKIVRVEFDLQGLAPSIYKLYIEKGLAQDMAGNISEKYISADGLFEVSEDAATVHIDEISSAVVHTFDGISYAYFDSTNKTLSFDLKVVNGTIEGNICDFVKLHDGENQIEEGYTCDFVRLHNLDNEIKEGYTVTLTEQNLNEGLYYVFVKEKLANNDFDLYSSSVDTKDEFEIQVYKNNTMNGTIEVNQKENVLIKNDKYYIKDNSQLVFELNMNRDILRIETNIDEDIVIESKTNTYLYSIDPVLLQEAENIVTIEVFDCFGNSKEFEVIIVKDNIAPTVTVETDVEEGKYVQEGEEVEVTIKSNEEVTYDVENIGTLTNINNYLSDIEVTVEEDGKTLTVTGKVKESLNSFVIQVKQGFAKDVADIVNNQIYRSSEVKVLRVVNSKVILEKCNENKYCAVGDKIVVEIEYNHEISKDLAGNVTTNNIGSEEEPNILPLTNKTENGKVHIFEYETKKDDDRKIESFIFTNRNVAEYTISNTLGIIDTINPEIEFSYESVNSIDNWNKKVGVQITFTDTNSGVKTQEYCISTKPTSDCYLSNWKTYNRDEKIILNNNEGKIYILARVSDNAGNEYFIESKEIKIDTEIELEGGLIYDSETWSNSVKTISLKYKDNEVSGIKNVVVYKNLDEVNAEYYECLVYSQTHKIECNIKAISGNGLYYIKVVDEAGNGVNTTNIRIDEFDTIINNPSIEFTDSNRQVEGYKKEYSYRVSYSKGTKESPIIEFRYLIVDSNITINTNNFLNTYEDTSIVKAKNKGTGSELRGSFGVDYTGTYIIYVYVKDEAGNVALKSESMILDNEGPNIEFKEEFSDSYSKYETCDSVLSAVLNGEVSDSKSGVESVTCSFVDRDYREYTASKINELEGDYYIKVLAKDKLGNQTVLVSEGALLIDNIEQDQGKIEFSYNGSTVIDIGSARELYVKENNLYFRLSKESTNVGQYKYMYRLVINGYPQGTFKEVNENVFEIAHTSVTNGALTSVVVQYKTIDSVNNQSSIGASAKFIFDMRNPEVIFNDSEGNVVEIENNIYSTGGQLKVFFKDDSGSVVLAGYINNKVIYSGKYNKDQYITIDKVGHYKFVVRDSAMNERIVEVVILDKDKTYQVLDRNGLKDVENATVIEETFDRVILQEISFDGKNLYLEDKSKISDKDEMYFMGIIPNKEGHVFSIFNEGISGKAFKSYSPSFQIRADANISSLIDGVYTDYIINMNGKKYILICIKDNAANVKEETKGEEIEEEIKTEDDEGISNLTIVLSIIGGIGAIGGGFLIMRLKKRVRAA